MEEVQCFVVIVVTVFPIWLTNCRSCKSTFPFADTSKSSFSSVQANCIFPSGIFAAKISSFWDALPLILFGPTTVKVY